VLVDDNCAIRICSLTIQPQQFKKSAFFLVVHPDQAVAELMAKCPKCGAITTYGLELAWRLCTVTCSECPLSMRLGDRELRGLRDQLVEARVRMDRLIDTDWGGA